MVTQGISVTCLAVSAAKSFTVCFFTALQLSQLPWRPRRPKATFVVTFLNSAGQEESPTIHKLQTLGIPVIRSLVSTTRLEERTSRYDPVKSQTKRRHILLFPAGKGEARIISLLSTYQRACRLLGFLACLAGAAVCFVVAFLTLPLLALRPAKFALSFRYVHDSFAPSTAHVPSSLGSLLVMFG
jgi:hypothetical protein